MLRLLAFCGIPLSATLQQSRRVLITLTIGFSVCFLMLGGRDCMAQGNWTTPYLSVSTVGTGQSVSINSGIDCSSAPGSPSQTFEYSTTPNTSGSTIGTNFPNKAPGPVTWTPTTAGTYYISAYVSSSACTPTTASPQTVKLVVTPSTLQGYINPKYIVVGVTYAPPGPNSSVTYTNTSALSKTSSTTQTFMTGTSVSVSLMHGVSIPKVLSGSITATSSTTFQQTTSGSQGITLSQMSQRSTKVAGPNNAYSPVNHDYDIIWVWLNPVEIYSVPVSGSGSVTWNGYGFDAADQPDLDIYPFTAGLLNGHLGSNPYNTQLSRSWATGQNYASGDGPALNQTDINNILAADPFTNPSSSYTFTLSSSASPATTTDGRFTLSGASGGEAQDFIYQQAAPGGQPITQGYQNGYSSMSSLGSSTSSMTSQTFGIDKNFASGSWVGKFDLDIKTSYTLATTSMASQMVSNTTGVINNLSITGPPCGGAGSAPCVPSYTGPTEWDVYQDNIYGTFLFYPIR